MDHDRRDAGNSRTRAGRQGRWSAVDAVIIILAVLCVASVIYRVVYAYNQRDKGTAVTQTLYDVTFEIEEVHRDVLSCVSSFDALYLYETGERIGYVGGYQDSEGNWPAPAMKAGAGKATEAVSTPPTGWPPTDVWSA